MEVIPKRKKLKAQHKKASSSLKPFRATRVGAPTQRGSEPHQPEKNGESFFNLKGTATLTINGEDGPRGGPCGSSGSVEEV